MSGKGQTTAKGGAIDSSNNHHDVSPATLDAKNEHGSPRALYWSVIHHKDLHEGLSTGQNVALPDPKESETLLKTDPLGTEQGYETRPNSVAELIFNERKPLKEVSTRSALTTGYDSASDSPRKISSESVNSRGSRGWDRVKESVETKELFIRHFADRVAGDNGGVSRSPKKWSDLVNIQYEFTLRECFILFVVLLAVGALAFSFLFEQWSILDSLYFTTVLLTTVGYGDITPVSTGGKLFASGFALVGIVLFGLVLGVLGSQLVETEIHDFESAKSKTSRALEAAFTYTRRVSRRRRPEEKEKIKRFIQTGERTLLRTESASSLESTDSSSTCSSMDDLESPRKVPQSTSPKPGHDLSVEKKKKMKERFPGLSVIKRHLPGFPPMLIVGVIMALLEKWGWVDGLYYLTVTATTIGFGDFTPTTPFGKICAVLLVPVVVGAMGYILGNVAAFIVEHRREEHTKKLWSKEMTVEDIEALDQEGDGAVCEWEYMKFMLVAMQKVDGALIDDLHKQFQRLDLTGDGQITKKDLKMMVTRKMRKVSHKLKLYNYKRRILKKQRSGFSTAVENMQMLPHKKS